PSAEHEQELPRERVEPPRTARIGGQVPAEVPSQGIEQRRGGERQRRLTQQQPQHRREAQQQHDVERQHVHVGGLEFQQQRLDERDVRLLEKIEDAHLLVIERVLESGGDVGDLRHVDDEQEHVRDVDLPGALEDAGGGDDEAALLHGAAVNEGRRVAGNEDED